jgi:hypothetical protein
MVYYTGSYRSDESDGETLTGKAVYPADSRKPMREASGKYPANPLCRFMACDPGNEYFMALPEEIDEHADYSISAY